ncbi:MAG: ABC transporter permease [Bacillota bacterium]
MIQPGLTESKRQGSRRSWRGALSGIVTPVVAVAASLLIGSLVIAMLKVNPLVAYGLLFSGAVGNLGQLTGTIVNAIPLIFAGLAVTVAFRGSIFNIGGEGQIYFGALFAILAGTMLKLPPGLHLLVALAAGALGGLLWALIPGYLNAKRGLNEVIITILMNYIATWFVAYLVHGPIREPGWNPQSRLVEVTARLPILIRGTSLHAGIILALLAAVLVHLLLTRTGLGFAIRMVGSNREASRYAGINSARVVILTMCISGALAGLAGASEMLGTRYRLLEGFSPGWGFDAIAVAMVGRQTALGTVLGALFFGALRSGATVMQSGTGLPVVAVYFIQGLIILFMIAGSSVNFLKKLIGRKDESKAIKEVTAGDQPAQGSVLG